MTMADPSQDARGEAFMGLLGPHLTSLTRMARSLTKNTYDADDLVQQTLLKALLHLDQFRQEASFKTWLISIAINELRGAHRKQASSRIQAFDTRVVEGLKVSNDKDSPAAHYERNDEIGRLHRALSAMPVKYQVIVRLRDLVGLSLEETARKLSLTVSATKTRHHRARKRLHLILSRKADIAMERSRGRIDLRAA